jgi:hypothetical protein
MTYSNGLRLTLQEQEIDMGQRGRIEEMSLDKIGEKFVRGLILLRNSYEEGSSEASKIDGILLHLRSLGIQPNLKEPIIAEELGKKELLTLAGQLYRHSIASKYTPRQKAYFELAARNIMLYVRSHYTLAVGPRRPARNAAE